MAKGKIACLLAQGYEDSEFKVPADRLKEAGYEVVVIGLKKGEELKGYKGKVTVKTDAAINEVKPEEFQGLLIPGGHSPDQLRIDERVVNFVRKFDELHLPLAAVCHGPQLLLTAGLVKGRTLTAWPTVRVDLGYAGANLLDKEVVVDDNWITSRKPEDLKAFSEKFLEELGEEEGRAGQSKKQSPQPNA